MRAVALALMLWTSNVNAEIVDEVVIVVEDQVILASDVRLATELAMLESDSALFWHPERHEVLERLIDAAVVIRAAGSVGLYQPTDDAIQARLESIRGVFPDRERWRQFLSRSGISEATLLVVLRKRMIVERYLARNLTESPNDPVSWHRQCDALMAELRTRYRIRDARVSTSP